MNFVILDFRSHKNKSRNDNRNKSIDGQKERIYENDLNNTKHLEQCNKANGIGFLLKINEYFTIRHMHMHTNIHN